MAFELLRHLTQAWKPNLPLKSTIRLLPPKAHFKLHLLIRFNILASLRHAAFQALPRTITRLPLLYPRGLWFTSPSSVRDSRDSLRALQRHRCATPGIAAGGNGCILPCGCGAALISAPARTSLSPDVRYLVQPESFLTQPFNEGCLTRRQSFISSV